jgi:hypothetical protein
VNWRQFQPFQPAAYETNDVSLPFCEEFDENNIALPAEKLPSKRRRSKLCRIYRPSTLQQLKLLLGIHVKVAPEEPGVEVLPVDESGAKVQKMANAETIPGQREGSRNQ